MSAFDVDVIVVGGGPVGLTAAMDLDSRGYSVIVVEEREFLEANQVKCNHVASRTMERFRRMGIAERIRNAGLPADYPHDVAFRTSLTGHEIGRIRIPSPEGRTGGADGVDTHWATAEPPHRINQMYLEPILMQAATERGGIDVRWSTTFMDFEQDEHGVNVRVRSHASGDPQTIRARYVIAADGARSPIRKQLGIALAGDAVLQHVQSTFVRVPGLYDLMTHDGERRSWAYYAYNARRSGHVYSIDGQDLFLVHTYLTADEHQQDSVDRERGIRDILGIAEEIAFEVLSEQDWVARRLLADRFNHGRVFLAGDASHVWVPYAGFGMNAGIADVLNLTWLLGAVLSDWAHPDILNAYEAERRPVTVQVSRLVKEHQGKVAAAKLPAHLEDETEQGALIREAFGREAYALNVQQFAAEGLNFGYAYEQSPIIEYDGEEAPGFSMHSYVPSTVPGCRAPHFFLSSGASVYDAFGRGYTLLVWAADEVTQHELALIRAADDAGVPLKVVRLANEERPAEYDRTFYIVREDQHVVWRGDEAPAFPPLLMQRLRGAA